MLAAPLLAEEASGIGALGIDPQAMFVYLLNFAVLAVILYFFAYKKILGVLDDRSNRIRESLEEADRVRVQAQEQTEQMQRTLDEGRQAGQQVLQEAREAASEQQKLRGFGDVVAADEDEHLVFGRDAAAHWASVADAAVAGAVVSPAQSTCVCAAVAGGVGV